MKSPGTVQDMITLASKDEAHAMLYQWTSDTLKEWARTERPDRTEVENRIRSYLDRGIAAGLRHQAVVARQYVVQLGLMAWLRGDDMVYHVILQDDLWDQFGMPAFSYVAQHYGLPFPDDDYVASKMAAGQPCSVSCMDGCL